MALVVVWVLVVVLVDGVVLLQRWCGSPVVVWMLLCWLDGKAGLCVGQTWSCDDWSAGYRVLASLA